MIQPTRLWKSAVNQSKTLISRLAFPLKKLCCQFFPRTSLKKSVIASWVLGALSLSGCYSFETKYLKIPEVKTSLEVETPLRQAKHPLPAPRIKMRGVLTCISEKIPQIKANFTFNVLGVGPVESQDAQWLFAARGKHIWAVNRKNGFFWKKTLGKEGLAIKKEGSVGDDAQGEGKEPRSIIKANSLNLGAPTPGVTKTKAYMTPSCGKKNEVINLSDAVWTHMALSQQAVPTLYLSDSKGFLWALEAKTGKLLWRSKASFGPIGALVTWKKTPGHPPARVENHTALTHAPQEDLVLVAGRDNVARMIHGKSAKVLWCYNDVPELVEATYVGCPLFLNQRVILGFSCGIFVSLQAQSGKCMWRTNVSCDMPGMLQKDSASPISPVFVPGTSLPQTDNLTGPHNDAFERLVTCTFNGQMSCLKPASGEIIWRNPIGTSLNMILEGATLWVLSRTGVLRAIEVQSGEVLWSCPAPFFRKPKAGQGFFSKSAKKKTLFCDKKSPLFFYGPFLVAGHVAIVGEKGDVWLRRGATMNHMKTLSLSVSQPPVASSSGGLWIWGKCGTLHHVRFLGEIAV